MSWRSSSHCIVTEWCTVVVELLAFSLVTCSQVAQPSRQWYCVAAKTTVEQLTVWCVSSTELHIARCVILHVLQFTHTPIRATYRHYTIRPVLHIVSCALLHLIFVAIKYHMQECFLSDCLFPLFTDNSCAWRVGLHRIFYLYSIWSE